MHKKCRTANKNAILCTVSVFWPHAFFDAPQIPRHQIFECMQFHFDSAHQKQKAALTTYAVNAEIAMCDSFLPTQPLSRQA